MAKTEISALQRAISTGSRSRRNPKVLPFDAQGDFRHFHVFGGHVTTYEKPLLEISKFSFRSSITQNVFLSEINSSDTGNLLKTRIPDLLQFLQSEIHALELLAHL